MLSNKLRLGCPKAVYDLNITKVQIFQIKLQCKNEA